MLVYRLIKYTICITSRSHDLDEFLNNEGMIDFGIFLEHFRLFEGSTVINLDPVIIFLILVLFIDDFVASGLLDAAS